MNDAINDAKYYCPSCGKLTNEESCPDCGTFTQIRKTDISDKTNVDIETQWKQAVINTNKWVRFFGILTIVSLVCGLVYTVIVLNIFR